MSEPREEAGENMEAPESRVARSVFQHVVEFRFFLPLAHEPALLRVLDRLFYADTLRERLHEVGAPRLQTRFPLLPGEGEAAYFARLVERVGVMFTGYSLAQVRGRFRDPDQPLETRHAAADRLGSRLPYVVEETTSWVTFVFPCGPELPCASDDLEDPDLPEGIRLDAEPRLDAGEVRFLFYHLFVSAVLKDVASETQVWLLEDGMRRRLWKFCPQD